MTESARADPGAVASRGRDLVARHGELLIPIGLGAGALLLAAYRVGKRSIWLDEAASIFVAQTDPSRFFELVTSSKLNMGLYFTALRGWITLGDGEGIVRGLSVIFAAVTVPLLYLTVRRLVGQWPAVVAAVGLAVNPFFIEWAQQARGYSLAMLLATAATYALVRVVDTGGWRWWLAYGVTLGLAPYAHVLAGFVGAAHVVAVLLVWRSAPILRRVVAGWLLAAAVAIPLVLGVLLRTSIGLDWVDPFRIGQLPSLFRQLSGGGVAYWIYLSGLAAALVVTAIALRRGLPQGRGMVVLLCWALVPLASFVLYSLVKPILIPRYLLMSLPALAAVVAAGWIGLGRDRRMAAELGVAVIVLLAIGLPAHYGGGDRADYRSLTRVIASEAARGDAIVWWLAYESHPAVYYAQRQGTVDRMPPPIATQLSWAGNPFATERQPAGWAEACSPRRIWLVGGPGRLPDGPTAGRAAVVDELLTGYAQDGGTRTFGRLRLRLFAADSARACD